MLGSHITLNTLKNSWLQNKTGFDFGLLCALRGVFNSSCHLNE